MPSDMDPIRRAQLISERQEATGQVFASDLPELRLGLLHATGELYALRASLACVTALPPDVDTRLHSVCMDIASAGKTPRDRVVVMEAPLLLLGGFVRHDGSRESVAALTISYGFGRTCDEALAILEKDVARRFRPAPDKDPPCD